MSVELWRDFHNYTAPIKGEMVGDLPIDSDVQGVFFDKMVEGHTHPGKKPSSADCLIMHRNHILYVEFKSWPEDKTAPENEMAVIEKIKLCSIIHHRFIKRENDDLEAWFILVTNDSRLRMIEMTKKKAHLRTDTVCDYLKPFRCTTRDGDGIYFDNVSMASVATFQNFLNQNGNEIRIPDF